MRLLRVKLDALHTSLDFPPKSILAPCHTLAVTKTHSLTRSDPKNVIIHITANMSGTSSVGGRGVYEAGDQRTMKDSQINEAERYKEGQPNSHLANDSSM